MTNDTFKKFISIILALVLCISASAFAFADDISVPGDTSGTDEIVYPSSALLSTVTDENVIEFDNVLREAAYQTAVRSTGQYNYDAGDIYNLLWQTLVGNGNYYIKVYDSNTYNLYNSLITGGLISDILTSLQNIESSNTYTDGIVQYTTSSLLYTIASNINTNNTNISSGLFDSNQSPFLSLIYSNIGTFETLFNSYATNSLNHLNSIDSNVDWIEQYSSYIAEATEQSLVPNVEHIDLDLHDIKQLLNDTFYYNEIVESNTYSEFYQLTLQSDLYYPYVLNYDATFSGSSKQWTNAVFESIPNQTFDLIFNSSNGFYGTVPNTLAFGLVGSNTSPAVSYNATYISGYTPINFPCEVISNNLIVHVTLSDSVFDSLNSNYYRFICNTTDYNFNLRAGNYTCYMSLSESATYNYIQYISDNILHIDNDIHGISSILEVFKDIYASDDLIQAKENQQELEDSVLEDFTGSGSASASVSDAIDIKGVQSSIKGSLNTGEVTPSGLSTILDTSGFNNQSSFFYFWSTDCYNDINGINSIPRTRDVYYHLDDSDEYIRLVRSQSW